MEDVVWSKLSEVEMHTNGNKFSSMRPVLKAKNVPDNIMKTRPLRFTAIAETHRRQV